MSKISLKTALCAVFFSLTALVLNVCILEPVTVNEYVENETVQGIIGRDAGKVNIITEADWADHHSDDIFTQANEGNRKITGLDPDKYYIIEEWVTEVPVQDENNTDGADDAPNPDPILSLVPENVQFVKPDGTRSSRLTTIGKVAGGTITELTNGHWYLVRSVEPLTGDVTYFDLAAAPSPSDTGTPYTILEDGKIDLDAPEKSYYLKFSPTVNGNGTSSCVKFPVSPPANSTSAVNVPTSSDSIKLEGKNTETDYIFHKKDGKIIEHQDGSLCVVDAFYILKVTIGDVPPPPELVITIVPYVHPTEPTFTFDSANIERTQTEALAPSGLNINVTVNMPSGFTADGWYYNNTRVNNSLALNNPAGIDFTVIGTYEFTFVMTKDGVPYSNKEPFKITITP